MFRTHLVMLAALLAAGPMAAQAQSPAREPPPGEGVICALAIYSAIAEVGARCRAGQDAALQSSIRGIVASLDDYVLRNGDISPEQLRKFKASQAGATTPTERLCKGDVVLMYDAMKGQDARKVRSEVDKLLARPGQPTWGTCL